MIVDFIVLYSVSVSSFRVKMTLLSMTKIIFWWCIFHMLDCNDPRQVLGTTDINDISSADFIVISNRTGTNSVINGIYTYNNLIFGNISDDYLTIIPSYYNKIHTIEYYNKSNSKSTILAFCPTIYFGYCFKSLYIYHNTPKIITLLYNSNI